MKVLVLSKTGNMWQNCRVTEGFLKNRNVNIEIADPPVRVGKKEFYVADREAGRTTSWPKPQPGMDPQTLKARLENESLKAVRQTAKIPLSVYLLSAGAGAGVALMLIVPLILRQLAGHLR